MLPRRNAKDLEEIPAHVRRKVKFVLAETMADVLAAALEPAA